MTEAWGGSGCPAWGRAGIGVGCVTPPRLQAEWGDHQHFSYRVVPNLNDDHKLID